ncbi:MULTISPECIES: cytochrome P450 [Streptomyces]|uniref:Cytochrome P450 n=1 Tax=Streptomyces atratus TaxID=1893 RepID=A0A1K1X6Z5_STRAR|nr:MULTISPECIES: cytochrome P450 [Streptomyces]MCX4393232.1 cytochrome P450 [Streptomyces sp. NBC_01767]MCX4849015.1 cytochrome P450 [Streptomyces sp. NBC_00893]SFX45434.1 Cytochrome P450 [Streptomyces atratus]
MTTHTRQLRDFPFAPAAELHMEPVFAQLRQKEPISRVRLPYGGEAWLVTRYQDIKTVLGDPRFSRAATQHAEAPRIQRDPAGEGVLMSLDPPDHTRLRKTVAGVFTKRRVEELRPATQRIAGELLEAMDASGAPADLVASYALPLPVTVICDLLGVPGGDRDQLRGWSDALLSTTACASAESASAVQAMADYFAALVSRRRREPTDDLLGALVQMWDREEGRLRDDELVLLARDLLIAGHETTASQIANCTYLLLQRPHDMDRLRADPSVMASAVEELLRFIPLGPGSFRARVATEPVELCGVRIQPGETVFAPTVAANWDPDVFTDPGRLDVDRSPNPHVAFGHGVHHCLGAQLARLELQVALGVLLCRLPHLRLAVDEAEIVWKTGTQVGGPKTLMVKW